MPRLFIIDAYTAPQALYPDGENPPSIIATLRAAADPDGSGLPAPIIAPAILCDGETAARARGAFLVTGDQDGTAIVLPAGLSTDAVHLIAAAHAWRCDPTCNAILLTAGHGLDIGTALPVQSICDDPAFHESNLKGCIVPSEWLLLAANASAQAGAKPGDSP